MASDSIFTKIIKKEIPCYEIAEDKHCFAFLDINPNSLGHTLCIPKKQIDNLFDLEEELYGELMFFSRKISKAIAKVMPCNRVGIAVVGLEVPHAHLHLIPINDISDISFSKKIPTPTPKEFEELASKIRNAYL